MVVLSIPYPRHRGNQGMRSILHVEVPDLDRQVVARHQVSAAVAELHVRDGGDDLGKKGAEMQVLTICGQQELCGVLLGQPADLVDLLLDLQALQAMFLPSATSSSMAPFTCEKHHCTSLPPPPTPAGKNISKTLISSANKNL
ncbi:hypothetical protein JZ751_012081 [Albula glossodonta]|uniref:Uncharacterized protein n=1 Tax=Albula glossodonta TaxID=121402 RepID=A0A8T2PRE3_9TELE|nr:hypothetical protein JZ751_012081 [Albula glossodonta]